MFNTNRNNIADLIEWQSGRRIDSLVSTGDNLAAKLAQAGATQLLTLSLHMAGFNEAAAGPAGRDHRHDQCAAGLGAGGGDPL